MIYRKASLSILELSPLMADHLVVLISIQILRISFSFVRISVISLLEYTPWYVHKCCSHCLDYLGPNNDKEFIHKI